MGGVEAVSAWAMDDTHSIDLGHHGIEIVDVEIRDLVAAINALPFVLRTTHSCAGYGRPGTAPRNANDHPDPTCHRPNTTGYVSIRYRDLGCWKFHEELMRVADWATEIDGRVGYYLKADDLAMKWSRFAAVVERWRLL
jgi:hypothetical protein